MYRLLETIINMETNKFGIFDNIENPFIESPNLGLPEEIFKNGINCGMGFGVIPSLSFSSVNSLSVSGRTLRVYEYARQQRNVTPTVRGNGRQKIIDNGKCTWPSAYTRKGH